MLKVVIKKNINQSGWSILHAFSVVAMKLYINFGIVGTKLPSRIQIFKVNWADANCKHFAHISCHLQCKLLFVGQRPADLLLDRFEENICRWQERPIVCQLQKVVRRYCSQLMFISILCKSARHPALSLTKQRSACVVNTGKHSK
ncbi:hypothetical protein Tsp_06090 [Trichinella spiralis]|uniref:hypothetical protein n=1 Tax=Trichinella spiralis TaxID=6334 RepID=UPI0001EFB445|nr:hypothetical protein Tsp_06090 [Trichinella spiralis]